MKVRNRNRTFPYDSEVKLINNKIYVELAWYFTFSDEPYDDYRHFSLGNKEFYEVSHWYFNDLYIPAEHITDKEEFQKIQKLLKGN